jgi:N-acetylglucosaminyldiphosphoundecaprenol N-acetyl-beta-D-mannosaminyltransferase
VHLLGMDIHDLDSCAATNLILSWTRERIRPCRMVVTPNINHAVLYQDDPAFRDAYSRASLRLTDGRYLPLISRLLGQGSLATVNGSDLVPAILAASEATAGLSVFLLGAAPGVAERAGDNIRSRYPWVRVCGAYSPPLGFERDAGETGRIRALIEEACPDLLVVGISPPRQEIWVAGELDTLNASVAVCSGATIDFLAGHKRRAPLWMQRSGTEWLYRTWTEPGRLGRRYLVDAGRVVVILLRHWLRPTKPQ